MIADQDQTSDTAQKRRVMFDAVTPTTRTRGILRHSPWDGLLVLLAFAQGALLLLIPSPLFVGAGIWWNANTVAHNFIHLPFFRSRALNKAFSVYLTAILGVPQTLWRDRHLAHHSGIRWRLRFNKQLIVETLFIGALWSVLLSVAPAFFSQVYLPGLALGFGLGYLQGHFEHVHGTVSHYGRLYNGLFFNDGYHIEHHAHPAEHWTQLPKTSALQVSGNRWPAVLRWLDWLSLESLERLVLRSPALQRFVLDRHERAFHRLLPNPAGMQRVEIVGGGLFPRTALVLRKILPDAQIQILDARPEHLDEARRFLGDEVELVHRFYDGGRVENADLLVIPLSFVGSREAIYCEPTARSVVVHDWIWRQRGVSVVVSWMLLKRLNLVRS